MAAWDCAPAAMLRMRRVLIVSPNWPPISCPDLHRVRMALPYFHELGWEPLVLHIDPAEQEGIKDPTLCLTIPPETQTWQARAVPRSLTAWSGLKSVGLRSYRSLQQIGARIIERQQPALVFFSTAMFVTTTLGPIWKQRFGMRYVIDMQDPWISDGKGSDLAPGGSFKYGLSRFIAHQLEPRVMRGASHVMCVSPHYVKMLRRRYPDLGGKQLSVVPFGAPERDFELLPGLGITQPLFDPVDGNQHWVYIGAVGVIMANALRILFSALASLRRSQPADWQNVRLHFAGTSYAPRGLAQKTVEPIARECGVGDIVSEITDRIPYFETLKGLTEANALIIVGSDLPSYSASKLYPYMLAGRPMLAVLHEASPAVEILRSCRIEEVVTFNPARIGQADSRMKEALAALRHKSVARAPNAAAAADRINSSEFARYTGREMTRRMCETFDDVVASK